MNIFATSNCPVECAEKLDDRRCVKMCLETAQLLSSALRLHGYTNSDVYKTTHANHPCSKWARKSRCNYLWLLTHFDALCSEYTARYNKTHASARLYDAFIANIDLIPEGDLTPFVNCARNKSLNIDLTSITSTTIAYSLYLQQRWQTDKRKPTWYGAPYDKKALECLQFCPKTLDNVHNLQLQ